MSKTKEFGFTNMEQVHYNNPEIQVYKFENPYDLQGIVQDSQVSASNVTIVFQNEENDVNVRNQQILTYFPQEKVQSKTVIRHVNEMNDLDMIDVKSEDVASKDVTVVEEKKTTVNPQNLPETKSQASVQNKPVAQPQYFPPRKYSFRCKFCLEAFYANDIRLEHEKIHINEKIPESCRVCLGKFSQKNHLKQFMVCLTCSQRIHTESSIKIDDFFKIPDQKSYDCEICQEKFNYKHELEMLYACKLCAELLHKQCKHAIEREAVPKNETKPTCEICGETFEHKGLIREHKSQRHPSASPFSCKICSKWFKSEKNVKKHMHLFHNTEWLKCKFCDKEFNQKKVMEEHLKIHSKRFIKVNVPEN